MARTTGSFPLAQNPPVGFGGGRAPGRALDPGGDAPGAAADPGAATIHRHWRLPTAPPAPCSAAVPFQRLFQPH